MRRKKVSPITKRELHEITRRIDAARGPVEPSRPEPPRPEAVRAEERERVLMSFPVERQAHMIRLDLIARTNSVSQVNLAAQVVEAAQARARENPRQFGMSVAEASAELGVGERMIERWVEAGRLRGERMRGIGPRLFIVPEDVARLKAEREARKSAKKGNDPQ